MSNVISETLWQELVIKHTKGGACNFQAAADELGSIVAIKVRAETDREPSRLRDGETCVDLRREHNGQIYGARTIITEAQLSTSTPGLLAQTTDRMAYQINQAITMAAAR